MRCLIPWLSAFLLVPTMLHAEDFRDRFEKRDYTDASGAKLGYRLLKPDEVDAKTRYPLVVFLHGAGERGSDNTKQLVHGMADFASEPIRRDYPCYVLAPQCPSNMQWVDVPWSAPRHSMPKKPAVPLRQTLELIDALQKEFSIDADRVYITGLSMGGFGTWDAIQREPRRFAAAAPVCGGGDAEQVAAIAELPIWAFHGDKDGVVKPSRSSDMIDAIRKAGGKPKYTLYPGVGHNSWAATYKDPALYRWMFAQRRQKN